jgi:hypothetical protein
MTKVKPTTKEQLIYFILHNLSLGTYDKRFLNNLQTIQISNSKPVTSNQSELLDKIVLRYAKQLRKKELDANDMVQLPWTSEVVNSLPEFTHAFVTIEDDIVTLRSPFKKDFVNEFRSTSLRLDWNKENKIWSAPVCEETLKHFINMTSKHYDNLHFCEKTTEIINTLIEYESAKIWNPTLCYTNGNLLIAGINNALAEAIEDLEFSLDLHSICRVIEYGIDIDDSVVEALQHNSIDYKLIQFAKSIAPQLDMHDVPSIVESLKAIQCDYAIITESMSHTRINTKKLEDELVAAGITCKVIDRKSDLKSIKSHEYKLPVAIYTNIWVPKERSRERLGVLKTVTLTNNKPIDIK